MKRLIDLRPEWIGRLRPKSGEGILFDCPGCGRHHIAAYFSNPRDGQPGMPQDPIWLREGEEFDALTIKPSIDYPCFHGWVECGRVFDTGESPLVVAGQYPNGQIARVALSPLQAIEIGAAAIAKATALLEGSSEEQKP